MIHDEAVAREEIRDLMARYSTAGDRRDFAGLAATFAQDGEMHVAGRVHAGRSEITSQLDNDFEGGPQARRDLQFTRHNLTTSRIRFEDAQTAIGRTYFVVFSDLGLDHAGVYVDRMSRASGDWLFERREIRIDYAHERSHAQTTRRVAA